ncbi:MAG: polymer-forming cytoskeletal protein [Paraclostridium sp.]|uniref:polymer-forming cytoskeletal protein n=1 Tax=Paraclostridium sp. TaxID=2023273 RepID=UPI0030373B7F
MENKLNSININGMGTYPGGEFDKVSISGNGKIHGNIICNKFSVSGNGIVTGNIDSEKFSTSGNCKIEGDINSKELNTSGSLKCLKSINSDKVNVSGVLKVLSDIECEDVYIDGVINCGGFLNCENFDLRIEGKSTIDEIGASTVNISYERRLLQSIFNLLIPKKLYRLTVNSIEGDNIQLENSYVKIIRGKNIKIGADCNIDTIEYSGTIEVDDRSKVKNINKI